MAESLRPILDREAERPQRTHRAEEEIMTVVKKEITVNAPREAVWQYFEDPDLLAGWLMRNSFTGKLQKEFQFYAQPSDDWDGTVFCTLVEFRRPTKIAFTWDANNIGGETLVTIELIAQGDSTRIRLVHANFENASGDIAPIVKRHAAGWEDHLFVLASQLAEEMRGKQVAPGKNDWTAFDLYVAIDAKPSTIMSAWSTINGMESFFVQMMRITGPDGAELEPGAEARPGDRFVWRWHNGRRVSGEYLQPTTKNEVQFTFVDSKISVMAQPYKTGSLLRLRQYDIPDTEEARMHIYNNCRAAWVYFLTVLKTLLEHGIDGRDKTRETGASFSTYFSPTKLGIEF
jgi:uncharacterized protein YndB with AHSA1/START domain